MPGNTDGSWGWTGGTPGIFFSRRRLVPSGRLIEQLDQVVELRGGGHFAHIQGFEREFGCEPQQCGDDDSQSVEQQRLRWLFVRVGIQVIGDAKQGFGVLHGPVGITDFTVVLVARHVRAFSAVG